MVSEYFEIAERAQLWTWDRARAFVRSRFPDLGEGRVMRGSLDDFRLARIDHIHCRHCAKPLACPVFGHPMRLVCFAEGGKDIVQPQRVTCRRWLSVRGQIPDVGQESRRDLE